jgi:circadian clock protein KaiC
MHGVDRIRTGVDGLDEILGGGLPAPRVYLLQGGPGVGKTTLALQFLRQAADEGLPTLYVTLSETSDELLAVARAHGWSMQGIDVFDMSAGELAAQDQENTLYVPAEVELGERMRAVLAEVERVRPRRLVIDSCSEMRLLAQSTLRFRRQILALKQEGVRRDCTILLIDNPLTPEGDVLLQSLVHGVIHLERRVPVYGAERRRLEVRKMRELEYRGGWHDFIIRPGRLLVFPRLVAAEHGVDFAADQVPSGVSELDTLVGGGLVRGTSTLLLGPAGSGKSALASCWAFAAAERGEQPAIFAFDEGLGTLFTRSAALGMDLRPHVEAGRARVQQVDPAEMSPGELVHAVREAVERGGARLVVIDSLNGYLNAMPEEQFLLIQLHELLTYLRQRGVVTVMVVAQHGLVASMQAPLDVSYLADTVLLLRFFEAAGRVRKAVSVLKKRSGRHEDTIRELMLGPGVSVGPPLDRFRGVLTGVPQYEGDASTGGPLLEKRGE